MTEYRLTTVDNPYDVFEDFANWFNFDEQMGYHTCSLLARVAFTSDTLSDEENALFIEHAIDEIIDYDPNLIYRKVSRSAKA